MDTCLFECCVFYREIYLGRADPLSRGVLPSLYVSLSVIKRNKTPTLTMNKYKVQNKNLDTIRTGIATAWCNRIINKTNVNCSIPSLFTGYLETSDKIWTVQQIYWRRSVQWTYTYFACLIILDISLQLQSQSRYTNSAHSEIMFHFK